MGATFIEALAIPAEHSQNSGLACDHGDHNCHAGARHGVYAHLVGDHPGGGRLDVLREARHHVRLRYGVHVRHGVHGDGGVVLPDQGRPLARHWRLHCWICIADILGIVWCCFDLITVCFRLARPLFLRIALPVWRAIVVTIIAIAPSIPSTMAMTATATSAPI